MVGSGVAQALASAASPEDFAAARVQMAFSLRWHIVIACFGVGMPAVTVFAEWRGIRSGDAVHTQLAHRWARAMGVLFAVGAVSGTILSFEIGMLWPGLMATYGQVIGLPFTLEGFAFFIEAVSIGIYLYGWDRLPPCVHVLTGLPVCVAGVVSAWFALRHRRDPARSRWFLRGAAVSGVAAALAVEAGWITTEVGRQPWIVWGRMRTEDAVTPIGGLLGGPLIVLAVYAALTAGTVFVQRRLARTPLPLAPQEPDRDGGVS